MKLGHKNLSVAMHHFQIIIIALETKTTTQHQGKAGLIKKQITTKNQIQILLIMRYLRAPQSWVLGASIVSYLISLVSFVS